jgi:hypothetical protein
MIESIVIVVVLALGEGAFWAMPALLARRLGRE